MAVRSDDRTLHLPAARDFLWQYVHCTPLTGLLPRTGSARVGAVERDVVGGWQPWPHDGGMTYQQPVIVATGRK